MALRSPYVLQVFSTEGLTATAFVATLNTEELGWLCAWEDQSTRKSARLQCLHPHPAPGAAMRCACKALWQKPLYHNTLLCTWVECAHSSGLLGAAERRRLLCDAPALRLAKLAPHASQ